MKKIILLSFLVITTILFSAFKQSYYYYTQGLIDIQNKNYKSAIDKFEKVLQEDPQASYVYQQLVYLYILTDDTDKLKNILNKIMENIVDIDTISDIANLLLLYDYKELAIKLFEKIVSLQQDNKDALLKLAELYSLFDEKKSLEYYEKYIKLNPEDTSVYLPIAILNYKVGNVQQAKEYLKKVPEQQKDVVQLLDNLLLLTTDYSSLIQKYEKYVEVAPKDYKSIAVLFSLLVTKKDLDKAKKYLDKILKIPKKEFLPEYYFYISLFYEYKNKPLLAAKYMQKYIKYSKDVDETPYVKLAYYFVLSKKHNKAKKILITANKKFNSEITKLMLFYFYYDNKEYKNAINILYELESISSTFKRINFYLGVCYDQLGNFDKTEYYMNKAIEQDPTDHEALNYLGYLYADKNINLDKAEQLILKALSYEPTNYAYIDSLAWVYYRKELYEKSEELFEQIKDCNDPVVYEHIGDVKLKLNKFQQAYEYYTKSLKLNPKNKNVKKKLKKIKNVFKSTSKS
jgi:tetratricopeptide (TPR) repeat protein